MTSYPPPDPSWRPDPGYGTVATPEDRNWAMAAHLGSLVTGWFALGLITPLVVLLAKGGSSPYVRRQAVESLNFQINALVLFTLFWLSLFLLIGFVLLPAYFLFYVVYVVVATVKVSSGQDFRYPLTVRIIS